MKTSAEFRVKISELKFDEVAHTYTVDGRELPSVTQILERVGLKDNYNNDVFYCDRGAAVHEATEFIDRDTLDPASVDPQIEPYLQAYRAFREQTGFEPLLIEQWLYSRQYGYAGTLDRVGWVNGKLAIFDIKTGPPARWHNLQLAAYRWLVRENHWRFGVTHKEVDAMTEFTLQLRDDGEFRLHMPQCKYRFDVFLGAVFINRWKDEA